MANEEHLAILREGAAIWKQWREENPEEKLDLRKADLRSAHLIYADLRYADLRYARLTEADLSKANISKAHIGWTTFGSLDLSEVKGLESVRHTGPFNYRR